MADDTKELLIKVSATTELLRSQLTAAENAVARFERGTDAVTQRVDRNFKQVGQSAGQLKSGMQQLSFQVNDMATMFAMGARPMQIFASQAGQVIQSVQLMSGGTSRVAAFLGGPWGMAISTAIVALSPFIAKLFETTDAADTTRTALQSLIDKQREVVAERAKEANAEGGLNALRDKRLRIETQINRLRSEGKVTSVRERDLREVTQQILEAEGAINASQAQRAPTTRVAPTARVSSARSRGGGSGGSGGRSATDPASTIMRTEMERMELNGRNVFDKIMSSEPAQADLERIDRTLAYYEEANKEVQDRLAMAEENRVQYMAGLFETAFNGGTDAIWENFENIGKQVIARVLAEFAIAQIGGKGGFSLGGAITTAFSAIFGGFHADGGRPAMGKISVVGERGPELFVPDAAGTIIPNHALGGGGMNFTINAPGATAETVAMIRRELANAAPALISAASGNTVRALNRKSL